MSDTTPIDAAKQRVRAEVERAEASVDEAKAQLKAAADRVSGGPARDPAHAAEQIADLRTGLERDLDALRSRAPDPAVIAQAVGPKVALVAGGTGLAAIVVLLLRRRAAGRGAAREHRALASAIAEELTRLQAEAASRAEAAAEVAAQEAASAAARGAHDDDLADEDAGSPGRWLALVGLVAGIAGGVVAVRARGGHDDGDDGHWAPPVDA